MCTMCKCCVHVLHFIWELSHHTITTASTTTTTDTTPTQTRTTIATKTLCKCANCSKLTINKVLSDCFAQNWNRNSSVWFKLDGMKAAIQKKNRKPIKQQTDRQTNREAERERGKWKSWCRYGWDQRVLFRSFLWRLRAVVGLMSFHQLTFRIFCSVTALCRSLVCLPSRCFSLLYFVASVCCSVLCFRHCFGNSW